MFEKKSNLPCSVRTEDCNVRSALLLKCPSLRCRLSKSHHYDIAGPELHRKSSKKNNNNYYFLVVI